MIVALLVLASVSVLLLLVLIAEVALFLRVRQGAFEEMLLTIEAEARSVRRAVSGDGIERAT